MTWSEVYNYKGSRRREYPINHWKRVAEQRRENHKKLQELYHKNIWECYWKTEVKPNIENIWWKLYNKILYKKMVKKTLGIRR